VDDTYYYLESVLDYVRSQRACANPNPGYLYQLLILEQEMKLTHQEHLRAAAKEIREAIRELDEPEDDLYDPDETITIQRALELVFRAEPEQARPPASIGAVTHNTSQYDDPREISRLLQDDDLGVSNPPKSNGKSVPGNHKPTQHLSEDPDAEENVV
jgi:hypothetical protein